MRTIYCLLLATVMCGLTTASEEKQSTYVPYQPTICEALSSRVEERRLKGIQAGWSPDEEQRRQKGIMPLGERAYGLREKPGHRNPWKK